MKILHSETYEREGNDSWLIDKIQIIREDEGLYLRHRIKHTGWNGLIKENRMIELDEFDSVEDQQKRVSEYIENERLTSDMAIPNLKEILEDE